MWDSIDTFRWGTRDRDSGDPSRRMSGSSVNGLDADVDVDADCNYEMFDDVAPSSTVHDKSNSNSSSSSSSCSSSSSSSSSSVSLLPSLSHDLDIISAAGFPTHSNYTRDFKDVLDYIYMEPKHFKVLRVAPFPSEDILSKNTALPSCAFPSDHLAVIVDLEFVD